MKKVNLLLIFCIALSVGIMGQGNYNQKLVSGNTLNELIEAQMELHNISGLSATIIKNDMEVWNVNLGLANRETGLQVTDSVSFLLYSATKLFTGIGLMQLWEDDLFELDDPINDYLPFTVTHPDFPDTDITFRMLMSHVAGIDDNWSGVIDDVMVFNYDTPISLGDFCYNYFSEGGSYYGANTSFTNSEPGTSWKYSNAAVTLLGYLIELIADQDYTEYIEEHILLPLEMNTSTYYLSNLDTAFLANEYIMDNNDYYPLGFRSCPLLPAGFLHTTREEIRNFQFMLLNKGSYNNESILDSATLNLMQTVQYPDIAPYTGLIFGYDHINDVWGHTGGMNQNIKTSVFHKYDENWGVSMLCNGADDPWSIIFMLYQYAHEHEPITAEFIEVLDDGDLILNSNEEINLNIDLRNQILDDLEDVKVVITCENEEVLITDSVDVIQNIYSGELTINPVHFHLKTQEIASGFEQAFTLTFSQNGVVIGTTDFTLYFGEAEILIIKDEEHFYSQRADAISRYKSAVENNDFSCREYDINGYNFPNEDFLGEFNAVIWFTGLDNVVFNDLFNEEQQLLIGNYLDGGGHLFISGQNVGDAIGETDFFHDYLHANHLSPTYNGYLRAEGVDDTQIGDGLSFNIFGGDGTNTQNSASVIEPINGAQAIFKYYASEEVAGISFEGDYKLVFLPFGFAAIDNQADRDELMERILNFFDLNTNISDIETSEDEVLIFPNPSNGQKLTIKHNFSVPTTIRIHNSVGQLIYESSVMSASDESEMPDLERGEYVVVFSNASKTYSRKIIVF